MAEMKGWITSVIAAVFVFGAVLTGPGQMLNPSGDDNRDGIVMEDESGWDCRTMGNRVCGAL